MGRPAKPIDAKRVFDLASDGANNIEIANSLGCSPDTIERRFAGELIKGRAERNISLRRAQVREAKAGNSTMLVWLGKQYLGQTDSLLDAVILDAIAQAGLSKNDLLELIKNRDKAELLKPKRSFEEFCEVAGYPKPFAKQILMRDFAMNETAPRMLLGARGYGKTDYAVILAIAYEIYLDHSSTNLIVTKSKERNAAMLSEIANACIKNGVMFDKQNSTSLRVLGLQGKDHSVSAVTIKTVSLRGRHPKRIILDDPVTEDDTAEATRVLAKKKYNEIYKLCSNIVIIGQPAHKFDLYAELRDKLKLLEMPWGTIPELDINLDLQRAAGIDEASISASYHLKILPEGTTPFDSIKYVDGFPGAQSSFAFIDPSSAGGDYTAISIVKAYMQGVAVVGFVYKKSWNHALDEIVPKLKKYNVKQVGFETNALGDQPLDILREVFKKSGLAIGVVGKISTTNKHSRIMSAGSYAHLIHLSKESDANYTKFVVQYEYKSKFDDAPDSLASALEALGLIRGKL